MKASFFVTVCAAGCVAALLAGCKKDGSFADLSFDKLAESANYQPRYTLSLHQIVKFPRAKQLEIEISSFDGRKIWINANQFFSSHNITGVKLLERMDKPGFYDLELTLDRRGCIHWIQMAAQFQNEQLALLVDGVYFGKIFPRQLVDEEASTVKLDGPFDSVMASGIRKYARKNYEHYNPSESDSWF